MIVVLIECTCVNWEKLLETYQLHVHTAHTCTMLWLNLIDEQQFGLYIIALLIGLYNNGGLLIYQKNSFMK